MPWRSEKRVSQECLKLKNSNASLLASSICHDSAMNILASWGWRWKGTRPWQIWPLQEKTRENLVFPYHACYQYLLQHATTIIVALAPPQPILQGDVYKGQALLRRYRGQCLLTVRRIHHQNHLQNTQKRDSTCCIPTPPAHVQGSARRACIRKQKRSNRCYKANDTFQFTSTLPVTQTILKDVSWFLAIHRFNMEKSSPRSRYRACDLFSPDSPGSRSDLPTTHINASTGQLVSGWPPISRNKKIYCLEIVFYTLYLYQSFTDLD